MGLEDPIVSMKVGDLDAVSSRKCLESCLALNGLLRRRRLLKIHEPHPAVLVDVDRRILVPFGRQEARYLGD